MKARAGKKRNTINPGMTKSRKSCEICQKWGVEVAVFRGNNRNRRRGFHNTYVFYKIFQKILNGEISGLDELKNQNSDPILLG